MGGRDETRTVMSIQIMRGSQRLSAIIDIPSQGSSIKEARANLIEGSAGPED